MNVTITPERMTDTPISPLLCGNFIEYGYGVQTEPMSAELLFNRSFEIIPPYTYQNNCWFGLYDPELWKIPEMRAKSCATDWSKFDWYHPGYEHNAWFAAPAPTKKTPISTESDYLCATTPYRKMKLSYENGGVHGRTHLLMESMEKNKPCGLAQRGKWIRKGVKYIIEGWVKRISGDGEIRFSLVPEGEWDNPVIEFRTIVEGSDFVKLHFEGESPYTGWCTFVMWLEREGKVACDAFSLFEGDAIGYWRKDVIETVRDKLKPSVIRWPGGCFASFYNFRYGIGPRDERKPVPSYYWGGLADNDAGSIEFASFCEAVGAESMVCVNMFHPKKEHYNENNYIIPTTLDNKLVFLPRKENENERNFAFYKEDFANTEFTDEKEGLRHVKEWVEYLNGSVDTPFGKKRAEDGHPEPFGIKFFELENEVYRWFKPTEYAEACVKYADAIKSVDPNAKVGIVSYSTMSENLREILDICGTHVDFLADRNGEEYNLKYQLGIMREFNRTHSNKLFYINPEWIPFVLEKTTDAYNMTTENQTYWFSKWIYAMNIFREMMMWQREGSDVKFICFNNLANTHAQNTMETPPDKVYLSAAGKAMGFMAQTQASFPLVLEGFEPGLYQAIQAQAAWDKDEKRLVLYGYNLTDSEQEIVFSTEKVGKFSKASVRVISAPDVDSMNRQERDDVFVDAFEDECAEDHYRMVLPPLSFTETVLDK